MTESSPPLVPTPDAETWRKVKDLFADLVVCRPALETAFANGLARVWVDDPAAPGVAVVDGGTTFLGGRCDPESVDDILDLVGPGKRMVAASPSFADALDDAAARGRVTRETRTWFSRVQVAAPEPLPAQQLCPEDWPRFREEIDIAVGWSFPDSASFFARGAAFAVESGGRFVSAAATVVDVGRQWEIGVFTAPGHRRQGLARRAATHLLAEAERRGNTPHWDAVDRRSATFARTLGFADEIPYACFHTTPRADTDPSA